MRADDAALGGIRSRCDKPSGLPSRAAPPARAGAMATYLHAREADAYAGC